MTIKGKLIVNLLLTSAVIAAICTGGYSSLRFIQDKFSSVAEKSAPYQVRTVEFERELQNSITSLLKVSASRTGDEFARFRYEAERSLESITASQAALESMKRSSDRLDVAREFKQVASEIFTSSEARIQSDTAAYDANIKITGNLKESTDRLTELEARIRTLQAAKATAFTRAMENTAQYSTRLRGVEELRNQIKELQAVLAATYTTVTRTQFLISRGKINMLLGRIAKNSHVLPVTSDMQVLTADVKKFLELQSSVITANDGSGKQMVKELLQGIAEENNRIQLTLNQEIELLSSRLSSETKLQGIIYEQSNNANSILLTNSEMVGLGLTVAGRVNRFFSLTSEAELDAEERTIRSLFPKIQEHVNSVEKLLGKLQAYEELKLLQAAHASLEKLRTELYATHGIVATLKKKLAAVEQAHRSADKLHAIVVSQSAKGKENISNARIEQETSIAAVKNVIQESITRIALSGAIAVVIGIGFGLWILRSIVKPLKIILNAVRMQKKQGKYKAELAERVASGDFVLDVDIGTPLCLDAQIIRNDEFGTVLHELVGMSEAQVKLDCAFRHMTESLRNGRDEEERRNRIKNGLFELNTILREVPSINVMADQALSFLMRYLGAGVGIMYGFDKSNELLVPIARYAVALSEKTEKGFRIGEGVVGEVALLQKEIVLSDVPTGYLSIDSAVGNSQPSILVAMPILHNDSLAGVLEFGCFTPCSDDDRIFLKQALEGIAIAMNVNRSQQRVADLLEQTQQQSEELRLQQEELLQNNEELVERTHVLEKIKKQSVVPV